jgi:hypothetical protein
VQWPFELSPSARLRTGSAIPASVAFRADYLELFAVSGEDLNRAKTLNLERGTLNRALAFLPVAF